MSQTNGPDVRYDDTSTKRSYVPCSSFEVPGGLVFVCIGQCPAKQVRRDRAESSKNVELRFRRLFVVFV